jgi:GT2 family glycosyltransferase
MISNDAGSIPVMIVPILAGPDLLYRMAGSIDFPVKRLVVVDNGMCVDAVKLRDSASSVVSGITVIPIPNNLGVAGSWNLGIKATALSDWWLIANFDAHFPAGSLQRFAETVTDGVLSLSGGAPPWCAFGLPASVVERVGLFDEKIHPAYYEDDDYMTRCREFGVPVMFTDISVHHDNSSTLKHGYDRRNAETFEDNRRYVQRKHSMQEFGDGGYSLRRRRNLSWD